MTFVMDKTMIIQNAPTGQVYWFLVNIHNKRFSIHIMRAAGKTPFFKND